MRPPQHRWRGRRPPPWVRRRHRPAPFLLIGLVALIGIANILASLFGMASRSRALAILLMVGALVFLVAILATVLSMGERANRFAAAAREEDRRRRVAEMAHELRTPLAIIRGEAEAMTDGVHPADPEHLSRIRDAAAAIESLVEDLGPLTDAEAGPMPLRLASTEVAEVMAASVDALRETAKTAGVEVIADAAGDLPAVEWDGGRVQRALQNLLANAIRHTPPGGRVTVSARTVGPGGMKLAVADTGPGFPPEILRHAFDRYVKDAGSPGSGLGLAIARDVAEAHGGRARARNTRDGAVVELYLPI